MKRHIISLASAGLISLALTACGATPLNQTANTTITTAATQPATKDGEATVKYGGPANPGQDKMQIFHTIEVFDDKGNAITLDAAKHPVLFFAYWCPDCHMVLQSFVKNQFPKDKLPILISTGSVDGEQLYSLVQHTKDDLYKIGAPKGLFKVYYLLGNGAPYVDEYPVYVWKDKALGIQAYANEESSKDFWMQKFAVSTYEQ